MRSLSPMSRLLQSLDRRSFPVTRLLANKYDQTSKFAGWSIVERRFAERSEVVQEMISDVCGDRSLGCMIGLVTGDWIGVPLEFLPAVDDKNNECCWDPASFSYSNSSNLFAGNDRGRLEKGQWSDDSAMSLCLADSLLANNGALDGSDLRMRFWTWWADGLNNSSRLADKQQVSFGLGYNIAESLLPLAPNRRIDPVFLPTRDNSGNGSLMRLAPVVVLHGGIAGAEEALARMAISSSLTTHSSSAGECCKFLALLCYQMIRRRSTETDLRGFVDRFCSQFASSLTPSSLSQLLQCQPEDSERNACWNWRSESLPIRKSVAARGKSYNGHPVSLEYFGSFSIDALAVALHSLYHSNSFVDCVSRAANHLGDSDSVAAIAGQMAGSWYGYSSIEQSYREVLWRWDGRDTEMRAAALYEIGRKSLGKRE